MRLGERTPSSHIHSHDGPFFGSAHRSRSSPKQDQNNTDSEDNNFDERNIATFHAHSSTADLMQTIIQLREANNRLQLKHMNEKEEMDQTMRMERDHLEKQFRKQAFEQEEVIKDLRRELANYQRTSTECIDLLSTVRGENDELQAALKDERSRHKEQEQKLQAAIDKMTSIAESSLRSDEKTEKDRALLAARIESMHENLRREQSSHSAEIGQLHERITTLRQQLKTQEERASDNFFQSQQKWQEERTALLRERNRFEEEKNVLLACLEEALESTEAVLNQCASCPKCSSVIQSKALAAKKNLENASPPSSN